MPSTLAQSKERKGSYFAIWQPCNQFVFPPPTTAVGEAADVIRSKDVQTAVVEKTAILTFEQHLADACNKETIGESNRGEIQQTFCTMADFLGYFLEGFYLAELKFVVSQVVPS